jgi:hypothetical protein
VLAFVQLLALTVYTYVTFTGEVLVLVSTSLTFPTPLEVPWLMPVTVARVQLNVAPDVELVAV